VAEGKMVLIRNIVILTEEYNGYKYIAVFPGSKFKPTGKIP
jgi:hypothetical protein